MTRDFDDWHQHVIDDPLGAVDEAIGNRLAPADFLVAEPDLEEEIVEYQEPEVWEDATERDLINLRRRIQNDPLGVMKDIFFYDWEEALYERKLLEVDEESLAMALFEHSKQSA